MKLLPALDLRGGRVVRLVRGEKGTESAYGDDPVAVARGFVASGASFLHVVDLDAAFGGTPQRALIGRIVRAVDVPVQVGGGIRTVDDFRELTELGAARLVFGTVAAERPEVVLAALEIAPEKVVVGVDVRDGRVAVRGWTESVREEPNAFGERWRTKGVDRFVFTDVGRDGVMDGLNVEATVAFARASGGRVTASGGIGALDHLRALRGAEASGVEGVIVGKALYARVFTLEEALAEVEG